MKWSAQALRKAMNMQPSPHPWARKALAVSAFVCLSLVAGVAYADTAPGAPPKLTTTTLALWLGVAAVALGALGQALKSNALDSILAKFSLPALPAKAVPWVTVVVGVLAAVVTALTQGLSLEEAIVMGLTGLFAGAAPVAGHELVMRSGGTTACDTPRPRDGTPPANTARKVVGLGVLCLVLCAGVATTQTACKDAQTALNVSLKIAQDTCHELEDAGLDSEVVQLVCTAVDGVSTVQLPYPRAAWAAIKARSAPGK